MLSVKQGGIKYHFWVFGMTWPGIEPGPLANPLLRKAGFSGIGLYPFRVNIENDFVAAIHYECTLWGKCARYFYLEFELKLNFYNFSTNVLYVQPIFIIITLSLIPIDVCVFYLALLRWRSRGVIVKVLRCGFIVNEFKFHSRYNVYFQTNNFWENYDPIFIFLAGSKIIPQLVVEKVVFRRK